MKQLPIELPPHKLEALLANQCRQVTIPLARQPPAHLDGVYAPSPFRKGWEFYQERFSGPNLDIRKYPEEHCPWGKKGDLLYVQEVWGTTGATHQDYVLKATASEAVLANLNKQKAWRSASTMRSVVARLWLKVTDVRLQRVQSLSKAQYLAEGPSLVPERNRPGLAPAYVDHLRKGQVCYGAGIAFQQWFKAVYGKPRYEKNVWVWVVSFERTQTPFKQASFI